KKLCKAEQQCCKVLGTCISQSLQCDNQSKTSHYAYRVSTSKIPKAPEIYWSCNGDGDEDKTIISPTPFLQKSPDGVCLDVLVSAKFKEPVITSTLNS
ncbi:MAG: hypothetical protein AAB664_00325, partial [Patescibacteria group bacterium]